MTTSGSVAYNPPRDQVINRALRLVGAYSSTDSPRPEQINDALETMNMWLKSMQVEEHLWLKQFVYLFTSKGQTSYSLGALADSADHCVTAYTETTLTDAIAVGANLAKLTSASGMVDGDYLGITNDNGVIEWFTAAFVGNQAVLSDDLAVACSAGNVVYYHTATSQIVRPTRISTVARKIATSGQEVPLINAMSRDEYVNLPNKAITGPIVQVFFDPQMVTSKLFVWPTGQTGDKLVLTIDRTIQDMISDENTYDFPQEWMNFLAIGLAAELAPEYGLGLNEQKLLNAKAVAAKEPLMMYDHENTSIYFGVSRY